MGISQGAATADKHRLDHATALRRTTFKIVAPTACTASLCNRWVFLAAPAVLARRGGHRHDRRRFLALLFR